MEIVVDKVNRKSNGEMILENISFKASPGNVVGILGPGESGKTSLLRILINILKPDSGSIKFDGKRINASVLNSIGYLPEERGLYQKKHVIEVMVYFGRLKNMPLKKAQVEAIRLLDRHEMIEYMDKPVGQLSRGLQQKLLFIIAILHDPQLLILDEPFRGIEPLSQDMLQKLIFRYRDESKTVIVATRQFNQAEKVCDEILFLNKGKTLLKGNLEKIQEKYPFHLIRVEADGDLRLLKEIPGVEKFYTEKQTAKLFVDEKIPPAEILDKIIGRVNVSSLEVNR
ncbi:MAG: ABC transporter ATP-binding protein, partial [Calditrichia bacterium]